MIAVLSRRAATEFCAAADLELIELPFATPAIRHWIIWHRRSEPDPAHRWLCQKLSAGGYARRSGEGSGRFLKKAAQKLLFMLGLGVAATTRMAKVNKVFLLLFVHKK